MSVSLEIDGEKIAVRGMASTDMGYVLQTWIRSYKPIAKVSQPMFEKHHAPLVRKLIANARVAIACPADSKDETTILGWACGDDDGLHYAYIPDGLRGRGLARMLIGSVLGTYPARIEVSHRFVNGNESRNRFVYNPYRLGVLT
ncbi:MAG: hypothetical protein KGL39_56335 [Patescibacteria group bacterium]|nr:hypothetical protein [Patescibacteria group bacterium]